MARIEDLIQLRNRDVQGVVNAPLLSKYVERPTGPFPMTQTFVLDSRPDTARVIRTHQFQIVVYIAPLGEGNYGLGLALYPGMRDAFLNSYEVRHVPDQDEESLQGSVDIAWLQSQPAVAIVPGSISISGTNETVVAPDSITRYYGFYVRGIANEKTNRS